MFNVSSAGEVEAELPPEPFPRPEKAAPRPRASKALPTDRMKFDVQVNALKAFATQSDMGKRAIGSDDIAPRLGITASTAGLNNAFFAEAGLLEKESKGKYKPTPEVVRFAQEHSFDAAKAGKALGPILKETWFFREVAREPSTRERLIEVLAYAAGTGKERQVQITGLLSWLEYAGLIATENGTVRAVTADDSADPARQGTTVANQEEPKPKGGKSEEQQAQRGTPLLSFNFDFSLATGDLAKLSPEQIKALYEAVGTVMAIKAQTEAKKD
jgi:hypothetical protein